MGGTYINQGFFVYDPARDRLQSLGPTVRFGGQITSLATLDGMVYLAHYTHARLSVYDPDPPWQPGVRDGGNPRVIGAVGHEQDRIPAAHAGADRLIYFGTIPEYGKLGGAVLESRSLGLGPILKIVLSRDGWGYGVTPEVLFRFSPDLMRVEPVFRTTETRFAVVLTDTPAGRLSFALGAELCELIREKMPRLPE